jgi:hypothetical protein
MGFRIIVLQGLALLIAAVAPGCSSLGPAFEHSYTLVTINRETLPAALIVANTVEGKRYEFQQVRGNLRLYSGSRFELEREYRRVWDGKVTESQIVDKSTGHFDRNDSVLVLRLTTKVGDETYTYVRLDAGRILRGTQDFGKVHEYVLE